MIIPEIKSPGNQDSLYLRSRSSRSIAVVPSVFSGIPNPFSKDSSLLLLAFNAIYKHYAIENPIKLTKSLFFYAPSTLTSLDHAPKTPVSPRRSGQSKTAMEISAYKL
jgi:hypothetical protein